MKFYETDEFNKLHRKWKKKLQASGFIDIERNEDQLSVYSYEVTDRYKADVVDYFDRAREFLLAHRFRTDLEKFIWEHHCSGLSSREISSKLGDQELFPQLPHYSIQSKINRLSKVMFKGLGVQRVNESRTT